MKKMLIAILLFIPCLSFAQIKEKDTINNIIIKSDKPLIIIDNTPVDSVNLLDLKVEDIEDIHILKEEKPGELSPPKQHTIEIKTKQEEWEVTVLDPGYESFLATQQSKEFYSLEYLKVKNAGYVALWNARHHNPSLYDPDIYEVNIDYNATKNYGLEFEYRLYMFFKFMEKENNISLGGGTGR